MAASRIVVGVLVGMLSVAGAARAQVPDAAASEKARKEAVAKGLAYLSGAWKGEERQAPKIGGVAIASLSGIAFLQSGSTPDAGPHRAEVNRCLELVLSSAQDSGLIAAADMTQAPMYGHGFAMLFLSEAYARSKDEAVRQRVLPVLDKAVALSAKAQNKEGGWRYQPVAYDADVSVTVGQLNGLLAAQAAGARVPDGVLKKAGDYVVSCQNDDGGFSYMARGGGGGNSGLPRSAAALAALQHAGAATPEQRAKAVAYVARFAAADADAWANGHVFYGEYYLAQALIAAGGEHRTRTAAAFRERLVKRQQGDGSWAGDIDNTYATSMALIALQMPDGWLTVLGPKKAAGPKNAAESR